MKPLGMGGRKPAQAAVDSVSQHRRERDSEGYMNCWLRLVERSPSSKTHIIFSHLKHTITAIRDVYSDPRLDCSSC